MRRNILLTLLLAGSLSLPACKTDEPPTGPGSGNEQHESKTDDDGKTDTHGKTDHDTKTDEDESTDSDTDIEEEEEILTPPDSPEYRDVLCGNGLIDPGESCDDKNRLGHDGCNKYCQIERGYHCTNYEDKPSICQVICGNGQLDENEACDDGNTDNHDGCNNKCQFEDKFDCNTDSLPTKCFAQQYFGNGTCEDPFIFTGKNFIYNGNNFNNDFTNTVTFCTGDTNSKYHITASRNDAVFQIALKKGQLLLVHANTEGDLKSFITKGACRNKPACSAIMDIGKNNGYYDHYYAVNDETITVVISSYDYNFYDYEIIIEITEPVCGDSRLILPAEECEDGNTEDGDGCDHNCKIEDNANCPSLREWSGAIDEPAKCNTDCGNGVINYHEECDDGNNVRGDGCDASCHVEAGYHCISGKPCEKDGIWIGGGQSCDDPGIMIADEIHLTGANFETDFPLNKLKLGHCFQDSTNTYTYTDAVFRIDLQAGETVEFSDYALAILLRGECSHINCDNKLDTLNDTDTGKTVKRYTATHPETVWVVFANKHKTGAQYAKDYDLWIKRFRGVCGDGKIAAEFGESCEDGNNINGDGCDENCRIEKYWSCDNSVFPSFCTINGTDGSTEPFDPIELDNTVTCGNGALDTNEQCDDGNSENGDGCDENCQIEWGYTCAVDENIRPDLRCKDACGNGRIEYVETCDDGNRLDGDGCDAKCQTEDGYICFGPGDSCVRTNLKSGTGDSTSTIGVVDGSFYSYYSDFAATFTNTFKLWGDNCHDNAYSAIAPEAIYQVTLNKGDTLTAVPNSKSMISTTINLVDMEDYGAADSQCIPSSIVNGRLTYVAEEDITLLLVLEATAPNESNWHGPASIYITIVPAK